MEEDWASWLLVPWREPGAVSVLFEVVGATNPGFGGRDCEVLKNRVSKELKFQLEHYFIMQSTVFLRQVMKVPLLPIVPGSLIKARTQK
jgi:hypothetical protein